ncbi:hypothetical protein ACVWYN_001323 [Pedobacter sp. UYP24]
MDRKNLMLGTKAPEFVQNDMSVNPISLSSFKDKYVLFNSGHLGVAPANQKALNLENFNDIKVIILVS